MKIILATESQNRQELMKLAGIPFTAIPAQIDEKSIRRDDPYKQVVEIARAKVKAVIPKVRNAAVIAADSCAVYRNQILEKPKYKMEAVEMLKQLSGRSNVFISGWVVHNTLTGKSKSGVSETRITFRELTEGEIIDYANDHDVVQWAAGYSPFNTRAISFVKKLSGSFTNFTHGLPLEEIVPILRDFDLL